MKMYMVARADHALSPINLMAMHTKLIPGKVNEHSVEGFTCWHLKRLAQAYIDKLVAESWYSRESFKIIRLKAE